MIGFYAPPKRRPVKQYGSRIVSVALLIVVVIALVTAR